MVALSTREASKEWLQVVKHRLKAIREFSGYDSHEGPHAEMNIQISMFSTRGVVLEDHTTLFEFATSIHFDFSQLYSSIS